MKKFKALLNACKIEANNFRQILLTTFIALSAENAMAAGGAGGLDGIKSIFTEVMKALDSISLVVVTIAFAIAGYKVVFGGRTIQEVSPILIGGVIIGAAGYLASLTLGK
ncbi:TrbC/VirB2 family protein [Kingella kingae]|uniref:TrbC/VirB2 family protein n=1 Tax=Kingella kingae TaxID=504 RepID=UPI00254AA6D9|nr:TrbC/VirB2 family protein [Kingella kingae]MDK4565485.1 TrbC/VirB2 family protein [Kingella kingae]